jgi:hypothetical protein
MGMSWFKKIINKIKSFFHKEDNMPQGLQVFDEHGKVTIDISDRLTQVIGVIRIKSLVGSIDVTVDGNRKLFYTISKSHSQWNGADCMTINGNKISWDFSQNRLIVAGDGLEVVYGVV